jgi:two-component system, cell cycle sensor histidine kinase and response regulator CckA
MQAILDDSQIVLDAATEGYVRFDADLRLTFVNPAAEWLLGASRSDLVGKNLHDICKTMSPLAQVCRQGMADREPATQEDYFEPQGRWYAITGLPDAAGGLVVRFSDITIRKQAEEAHLKLEEKFSKAFQSSPAPMCIVDIDGNARFMEVNDAFERVTGYSRSEAIGHTTTELGLYVNPRDLEESRRRLLADGGYRNLEVHVQRKDGEILIGQVSAEQIELDGRLCAISVAVDNTEHRHAEQALRDKEELYRQLFELESDAVLLVDQESGRILAANRAATLLYGYGREQLLSMNRVDLSAEPEETIRATMRMQTFIPLRWHRKKDGTVFPVEISGSYFDLKGRSVFVSAIRDITGRRLMEEALNKSEEKFSKAFQSNPAAIMLSDLASQSVLEVNETFQEVTGYRREDVVGRGWSEVEWWANPADRDTALGHLLAEGKLRNWEFNFRKKGNGDLCRGLLSAELIELDRKLCAITTVVDITGHFELECQLRQAQKLESVGRLAGGVAHDFNNLLTIINGYTDYILSSSRPGDSAIPYLQEIKKAGDHAAGLTKQLLAFSRKQVIEPRPLDVNTIVIDTKRMLQRLIGEDIELSTSLDPHLPQVMADPDQVNQVIMNLVVNARDAMPDGGGLEIGTGSLDLDTRTAATHPDALPGRYVVMTVTDTGVGMDDKTMQSAFEPFFTTKEQGRGTGLGLSTVYGIVRQNGGWVDVRSEVGRGTTFSVYLPRLEGRADADIATQKRPCTLNSGETILVVEDNSEVRRLTRSLLETRGYRVLEAASSIEALALEKEHAAEIDLLLTDVILPGMNGKALADQMRVLRPDLKVLFTSGYTADVIASRGVLEPGVAYLAKPFTLESLTAKVREALTDPAVTHEGGGAASDD